jgi:hypothetical protein
VLRQLSPGVHYLSDGGPHCPGGHGVYHVPVASVLGAYHQTVFAGEQMAAQLASILGEPLVHNGVGGAKEEACTSQANTFCAAQTFSAAKARRVLTRHMAVHAARTLPGIVEGERSSVAVSCSVPVRATRGFGHRSRFTSNHCEPPQKRGRAEWWIGPPLPLLPIWGC